MGGHFEGKPHMSGTKDNEYKAIIADSKSGEKQIFAYEFYLTIHAECHQFLLNYEEETVERFKVKKFLYNIKFSPINVRKATVLAHPQIINSYLYYQLTILLLP